MFLVQLLWASALFTTAEKVPSVKLSSGHYMPIVGFGTWQLTSQVVEDSVTNALKVGYRHIDTAYAYENEKDIGKSLKKWFDNGGNREELFITTKLPVYGNRASDVEYFLNKSLQNLGVDYVDMFLVHVPFGLKKNPAGDGPAVAENGSLILDYETDHVAIWKAMEQQQKEGRSKSIGLSNFNISQIENILQNAEIKPSNLQIELHAYMQQKEVRKFCKQHDIFVTSYSTLGSPGTVANWTTNKSQMLPTPMKHPKIVEIAKNHSKSPAQVLLRFVVQSNIAVIPKSTHVSRMKENIELFDFELTDEEMDEISNLDLGTDGRIINVQGFLEGVEKHPLYPFPRPRDH